MIKWAEKPENITVSGILHVVVGHIYTDVSEEFNTSILKKNK
jgi:hypothetical protein